MKKKIIALLSTVLIVGSLAGCGTKTQAGGTASTSGKRLFILFQ